LKAKTYASPCNTPPRWRTKKSDSLRALPREIPRRHGRVAHALHLRDEGLIRLPDPEIAAKAVAEDRIVLTFDLDFGDILATARSEAPSVVIFRLRNQTPAAVNPRLFRVINDCAAELLSGA
jgi:predicted nuclease of predicted toxin-antitoxin system